jgi:hypothetical protein
MLEEAGFNLLEWRYEEKEIEKYSHSYYHNLPMSDNELCMLKLIRVKCPSLKKNSLSEAQHAC